MVLWISGSFLAAAAAPWAVKRFPRHAGMILALWPGLLFVWFLSVLPRVGQSPVVTTHEWIPALGIRFSLYLDGLALLMSLLISGIGSLVILYAGRYLERHPDLGKLLALLLAFMASMLGLVLSGNLLLMFVFWELTSIVSYLLIGFHHEDEGARRSALQGLFVTFAGGLALMTGLILIGSVAGSYEWRTILDSADAIQASPHYPLALVLLVVGAMTKSAQFPFHFWLPNAMAAPTPVSAYLHSATMVKAGVFLLARTHPVLGGTALWTALLGTAGAVTLLLGIWLAMRSTGIKRVLAYSTIMALGTLTMLIGVGSDKAIIAAMAFLFAHSLYKGALFMIAGILDHQAGVKDLTRAGGLARRMPVSAAAAGLAALSLAGVLPLFGFVAKEKLFLSIFASGMAWLTPVVAIGAVLTVGVGALVGIQPWYGKPVATPRPAREPGPSLLAGPLILATGGILFGLFTPVVDQYLLTPAASAVTGHPVTPMLKLWHGLNLALATSIASLALGLLLYRWRTHFRHMTRFSDALAARGPEWLYDRMMALLVRVAGWQTRMLQSGYLRHYLLTTLLFVVACVWILLARSGQALHIAFDLTDIAIHEVMVMLVMSASAILAATSGSRLGAVAALGAVGFTVALVFVLFSAADPGITQVLVETLAVIMLVLVLFRLPRFLKLSSTRVRVQDATVAITLGATFTVLLLLAQDQRLYESISAWHIAESVPSGYGRNVVNVILVDFRALDTLGEIFVLALAAVGVLAMLGLKAEDKPQ